MIRSTFCERIADARSWANRTIAAVSLSCRRAAGRLFIPYAVTTDSAPKKVIAVGNMNIRALITMVPFLLPGLERPVSWSFGPQGPYPLPWRSDSFWKLSPRRGLQAWGRGPRGRSFNSPTQSLPLLPAPTGFETVFVE